MQILRNRKTGTKSLMDRTGMVGSGKTKKEVEGGEVMMMAGAATEWEWGWGSGGGWLSELACCEVCVDGGLSGHVPELYQEGMDAEPDCELGDTDMGADFGDFGF